MRKHGFLCVFFSLLLHLDLQTFVCHSTQPDAMLNINEMEYGLVFFFFYQFVRYISAAIHSLSTFNTSLIFWMEAVFLAFSTVHVFKCVLIFLFLVVCCAF